MCVVCGVVWCAVLCCVALVVCGGVWCVCVVVCGVCVCVVCGVCGVWCVVCGVWCVVCGVWSVVCGVWCVVCGVCGTNDSQHGVSVQARADYAPNSGGRTPGSKLPASPPPRALDNEELFVIEG